jgi:hypothetical protein
VKQKLCPTCGHPQASDEIAALLSGKQRRLYEIVRKAGTEGIAAKDIMRMLYADDPTGGPETCNIISVFANKANQKIAGKGLKIHARRGPWPLWRLMPIEVE